MFYQGDIQSGIASAMREAKPVVCFVRDDQEESASWEDTYFDNEELRGLLSNNAVTLRLIAGTQEAGFLTSLCPLESFPAVIVIRSGVLQEFILAGTSKDDFQTRLKSVLAPPSNIDNSPALAAPPLPAEQEISQPNSQVTRATVTAENRLNQDQTPEAPQITNESAETNRERIRQGKRPEKQMTPEERKTIQDKEDRRAMQLKLQREQKEKKEERERIRNQIKRDQEARRQRAAEEKNKSASIIPTASSAPTLNNTTVGAAEKKRPTRNPVSDYRLQIRLFDGSSVRTSFPPSATISKDVRPWLDSQRSDGSQPYNLKHILTPLPNRTISVAEEERALEELELGPTASLVMVPVPSYIEAYAPSGMANSLPGRVISSGYGLVSGVVGGVTGMVGGILGYGSSSTQPAATSESTVDQSASRAKNGQTIHIRTLHDQRDDHDKNEFYNGNTLNFEPRRDDESKDK